MLQKASRDHSKQLESVRFLLTSQITAAIGEGTGVGGGGAVVHGGAAVMGGAACSPTNSTAPATTGSPSTNTTREEGGGRSDGGSSSSSGGVAVNAVGWNEGFKPIGYLESCFVRKNGTPRQGGIAASARARLKLTCFGARLHTPRACCASTYSLSSPHPTPHPHLSPQTHAAMHTHAHACTLARTHHHCPDQHAGPAVDR
jgi:hypothetical protein